MKEIRRGGGGGGEAGGEDKRVSRSTRTSSFLSSSWLPLWVELTLLAAVSVGLYWQTTGYEFTFDDERAVVQNRDLRPDTPWSTLLHHDFWGNAMDDPRSHKSYRPVTVALYKLIVSFSHGARDPFAFHLANVALNAFVCVLVHLVLRFRFHLRPSAALIASLIFVTHPTHTEAVCSAVGIAEVASACLLFSAWLVYPSAADANMRAHQRALRFVAFGMLTAVAMLAKEQGIVVAGVAGAIDTITATATTNPVRIVHALVSPPDALWKRARAQLLVCVSIGAALLAFRVYVMHGQKPPFTAHEIPAAFAPSWGIKAMTMNYYVAFNAKLLLWPVGLCHDWSHSSIPLVKAVADPRNAQTALLYAVLLAAALWAVTGHNPPVHPRSRSSLSSHPGSMRVWVLCALLYLTLTFLPASNLLFNVGFVVAERVLFTPSLGFAVLVGLVFDAALQRFPTRTVLAAAIALCAVYATLALGRSAAWRNNFSLHEAGMQSNPLNEKMVTNWGILLHKKAATAPAGEEERQRLLRDAEAAFKRGLRDNSTDAAAELNYGIYLTDMGRTDEAKRMFERGLAKRDPTRVTVGLLQHLGALYFQTGDPNNARTHFLEAWKLNQDDDSTANGIGVVYATEDNHGESSKWFRRALALNPDHAKAHFNLGTALFHLQQYDECVHHLRAAIRADPTYEDARKQLKLIMDWLQQQQQQQQQKQQ